VMWSVLNILCLALHKFIDHVQGREPPEKNGLA